MVNNFSTMALKINRNFSEWISFKNKGSWITLLLLIIIILMELYIPILIHLSSIVYFNNHSIQLAQDLTKNITSDGAKAKTILEWEADNYNPIYLQKRAPFVPFIYYKNFHLEICQRTDFDNDPSWITFSMCGACGESASLYAQLLSNLNIPVRIIKNSGEDHAWNEAWINNRWVIIDPSRRAYDVPVDYYSSYKNLSYVYAKYLDGTRIDLTSKYTNKTGRLILFINNSSPKSVDIISNSLNPPHETEIECSWQDNRCILDIGATNYTIFAYSGNFIKHFETKNILLEENQTLEVEFHPNKFYIGYLLKNRTFAWIVGILIVLFLWLAIGFMYSEIKASMVK